MNTSVVFGILVTVLFGFSAISMAEAHPHATIDLMESHSHDPDDENFQEEFILHEFEHVIVSVFDFLKNILFG